MATDADWPRIHGQPGLVCQGDSVLASRSIQIPSKIPNKTKAGLLA